MNNIGNKQMDIIRKIYLKELIETATLRNGWDNSSVSKKMKALLVNPDWLNSWVRSTRGKYSIEKAMAIYRTGKLSKFLPK